MRKFFYAIAAFAVSATSFAQIKPQSDLTSKLQNADFGADEATEVMIRTYDYDMTDDGAGAGGTEKFGQQVITGWTALTPTDNTKVSASSSDARTDGLNARAAGIYSYIPEGGEQTIGLAGTYYAPFIEDVKDPSNNNSLGMVAVWGGEIKYTQDVTLPAGTYMLVYKVFNTAGTGAISANHCGFIAGEQSYMSKLLTYETSMTINDTVFFTLDAETAGQVSIGYKGPAGSGSMPHLFFDCVKLYSVNPADLDLMKANEEKVNLAAVIEEGKQLGADTKAAQAVLENPSATLAQVLAAIKAQQEINAASVVDLSEYFLKNPHFDTDDAIAPAEGAEVAGICTYDYDRSKNKVLYYGMQPVTNWVANRPAATIEANPVDSNTGVNNGQASGVVAIGSGAWIGGADYVVPSVMSDGSTEGKVLGFVGCWSSRAQYTQAVSIPAGTYTLTISYYNTGGTDQFAKNLMGFIADNGDEYLSDVMSFPADGKWHKMTIKFDLSEPTSGMFTLGYEATNVGSAKMPHFFIDGITLNYVGDATFDPSLFALKAAVDAAKEIVNEKYNADLQEEFEKAISDGEDLVAKQGGTPDENKAATAAINELIPQVNACIDAYKKLTEFRDTKLQDAMDKYENLSDFETLYERIGEEIADELEGLDDGSFTAEEALNMIALLDKIIAEETEKLWKSGEKLEEDLDITPLLSGLAYTYSTSAQSNTNVPDKEWAYGNATNFKTQYGTAEVWNQSPFTVTRTLENMPAGTYTIKTKAFYRTADQATNYNNFVSGETTPAAFVWAGYSKNPLPNVALLATDNADAFVAKSDVGEGLFVPNSQQAAHDVFENPEYAEIVETSVKTVLTEDGNLNFGIRADQLEDNAWVVWYSFEIAYNVVDEAVLAEEVANLKAEIETYKEENVDVLTVPAIAAADAAVEQDDLKVLAQTLADLKENKAAVEAVIEALDNLTNALEEHSDAPEAAINKASDLADSEYSEMTTAEVKALTEEIKDAAARLAVPDVTGASDNAPIDLTSVIVNPSFDTIDDFTGWNAAGSSSFGAGGTKSTCAERYEMVFNTYQDILGLPEGTYGVTVQGFYRHGGTTDDYKVFAGEAEQTNSAFLYAEATGSKASAPLPLISSGAVSSEEALGGGTAEAAENKVVPNTMEAANYWFEAGYYKVEEIIVKVAADGKLRIGVRKNAKIGADWVIVDNFTLKYYGNESAKEVSGDPLVIAGVETASAPSAIYSIAGAKLNTLQKGLNIVIVNGVAKKVLVK